jgi:hypothetical protein
MATKAQVIKLLAQQGATWSERYDFDEYEFECGLPEPLMWTYGCGSFAQTKMPDETMSQFWSSAMCIIGTGVVKAQDENKEV